MWFRALLLLGITLLPSFAIAERLLPPLRNGTVVTGPGRFRHDGELFVRGKVTLKHMTLDLHGPIHVATGATLELDDVHLLVSDPNGAAKWHKRARLRRAGASDHSPLHDDSSRHCSSDVALAGHS